MGNIREKSGARDRGIEESGALASCTGKFEPSSLAVEMLCGQLLALLVMVGGVGVAQT